MNLSPVEVKARLLSQRGAIEETGVFGAQEGLALIDLLLDMVEANGGDGNAPEQPSVPADNNQ